MPPTTRQPRLLNYNYCLLLLCNLTAQFGYSMVTANVASYAHSMGVTGTLLGMIPGLMAIAALCARPVSGIVSDRIDRKLTLVLALAGLTLVFLGYAFSVSVWMLVVVRVLHGVFYAFCSTVNMTMVADVIPAEKMARGLGYFGICGTIASAVAPGVGHWLNENYGFRVMFLCAALAYFAAFAVSPLIRYRSSRSGAPAPISPGRIFSKKALPAAGIGFCNAFTNGAISGLLLLFALERGIANASIFFTVFAAVTFCSRPLFGYLADRLPPQYMVYPCDLCIIATLVTLSASTQLWHLLLAAALFGMGYGGLQPMLQSMSLKAVTPDERGVASSTYCIGLDGGNGLGPVLCSTAAALLGGYGYGFLVLIVPVLCGMAIMFFTGRNRRQVETAVRIGG